MITFIRQDDKQISLLYENLSFSEDTAFVTRSIYTAKFSVKSYIEDGKKVFDFSPLLPLLAAAEITNVNESLASLSEFKQAYVHILANLIKNTNTIYIDLSRFNFNDIEKNLITDLILYFKPHKDEIVIITNDEVYTKLLHNTEPITHFNPEIITVDSQINPILIFARLFGGKFGLYSLLAFTTLLVAFSLFADTKYQEINSSNIYFPENWIVVENNATDCSFNKSAFSVEAQSCEVNEAYTYLDLNTLLELDSINAIYFDDNQRINNVEQAIENQDTQISVSLPELPESIIDTYFEVPCTKNVYLTNNVTCEQYNPDSSLISVATKDDSVNIERNVLFDRLSKPSYIVIDSSSAEATALKLATTNPSINVYTNQSIHQFYVEENMRFILKCIFYTTALSIGLSYLLRKNLISMNICINDLVYYYSYMTLKPRLIKRLFILAQVTIYTLAAFLVSYIVFHNSHSYFGLTFSLYLVFFNILQWVIITNIDGQLD